MAGEMVSSLRPFRPVFVTAFSLWFAVSACLLGCTQMNAAERSAVSAVGNPSNPTAHALHDLAADIRRTSMKKVLTFVFAALIVFGFAGSRNASQTSCCSSADCCESCSGC